MRTPLLNYFSGVGGRLKIVAMRASSQLLAVTNAGALLRESMGEG